MNANIDFDDEEEPGVNPVHVVLTVCGINNEVSARNVFIDIEGLDSLDKFAMLDGDGRYP